jgi:hypothetical protein
VAAALVALTAMSIRDWVELTLLVILTLTGIGRWIATREQHDADATKGVSATRQELIDFERRHVDEHRRLWAEIERNRNHWHQELVPWQQKVAERLATIEGQIDRRRTPRP